MFGRLIYKKKELFYKHLKKRADVYKKPRHVWGKTLMRLGYYLLLASDIVVRWSIPLLLRLYSSAD